MATKTILDLRRNDQRGPTPANPFWITSAEIDVAADDLGALLFSFAKAGQTVLIHQALMDVTEAFVGGTVACTVGSGTLATDAITTGGDVTIVDADDYLDATDLSTMAAISILAATASDLGVAIVANTLPAVAQVITGAATTVPCVYVTLTSDAAITAGKCRVKMLVSILDDI
jgi:hypothetical protein